MAENGCLERKPLCPETAGKLQFVIKKADQIMNKKSVAPLPGADREIAGSVRRQTVVAKLHPLVFIADGHKIRGRQDPVETRVQIVYLTVKQTRLRSAERLKPDAARIVYVLARSF